MRYLVVTDDATRDDIEEAIRNLRAKQQRACIESTRQEIADDIDELIEMWSARASA